MTCKTHRNKPKKKNPLNISVLVVLLFFTLVHENSQQTHTNTVLWMCLHTQKCVCARLHSHCELWHDTQVYACVFVHVHAPSLSSADWIMHYSEFNIRHYMEINWGYQSLDIHMWQTLRIIFESQSSLWKSGVIGWGNWVWKL